MSAPQNRHWHLFVPEPEQVPEQHWVLLVHVSSLPLHQHTVPLALETLWQEYGVARHCVPLVQPSRQVPTLSPKLESKAHLPSPAQESVLPAHEDRQYPPGFADEHQYDSH
jgi:hypothetical protein